MIPGSSHNRSSYFTSVFSRPLKGRMWVPRLTTLSHMGQSHVSQPLRSAVMVDNVAFPPRIRSQILHGARGPQPVSPTRGEGPHVSGVGQSIVSYKRFHSLFHRTLRWQTRSAHSTDAGKKAPVWGWGHYCTQLFFILGTVFLPRPQAAFPLPPLSVNF